MFTAGGFSCHGCLLNETSAVRSEEEETRWTECRGHTADKAQASPGQEDVGIGLSGEVPPGAESQDPMPALRLTALWVRTMMCIPGLAGVCCLGKGRRWHATKAQAASWIRFLQPQRTAAQNPLKGICDDLIKSDRYLKNH